jgi:hypothetical protein
MFVWLTVLVAEQYKIKGLHLKTHQLRNTLLYHSVAEGTTWQESKLRERGQGIHTALFYK